MKRKRAKIKIFSSNNNYPSLHFNKLPKLKHMNDSPEQEKNE